MLEDTLLWIMLNTLILIVLTISFLFLFAWAYSEIQYLKEKKDCFYNEKNNKKMFKG